MILVLALQADVINNVPGTGERLLEANFLKRIFAVAPLQVNTYLNLNDPNDKKNVNIELSIDQAVLDLKAPMNNPIFTAKISVYGTLSCPQLSPHPSQNNLDTITSPGLYHYDAGLSNAPSSSANFRSIEMGREGRYSQIAMPWDADHMFFRRQQCHEQGNFLTPWK